MKVYYAHFMGIYNTPAEERDIATLEALGLTVVNPNTPETQKEVQEHLKRDGDYENMFTDVFYNKVIDCEVFAFRGLPDGRIPGGIAKELHVARGKGKIMIELPCGMNARAMGKLDTREYLHDIGQR